MQRKYSERNRPVATWLTQGELALFKAVARANNVTPAAYLRAMIVDVLLEEGPKVVVQQKRVPRDLLAGIRVAV